MPTAVSLVLAAQGLQLSCSNISLALFEALIIAFHLTSALNLTHLRQAGSFVMLLPTSVGSLLTMGAQNWGLSCGRSLKNSSMLKLLCVDKTGSPACILSGKGDAYRETIGCSGYQWPSETPARKYHSAYGFQLHFSYRYNRNSCMKFYVSRYHCLSKTSDNPPDGLPRLFDPVLLML